MSTDNRLIAAEDLYKFQIISHAQISPDGQHVVIAIQRVNQENEKKYTNLWLARTDGSETRQFSTGDQTDSLACWSPDSQTIAFLSNRANEKQPQIYLLPVHGGEAQQLTANLRGAIRSMEWSPGGDRLLVSHRQEDEEAIKREEDPKQKELGIVVRHITRTFYKADGGGYLPRERWHIWTVGIDDGQMTQLTTGDWDENNPTWSPDGEQILFASNRHPDPDRHPDEIELYTIPAAGGTPTQIETGHHGQKHRPQYSPDGQQIAYYGRQQTGRFYQNTCLYLVPAVGGTARNLTAAHDLHLGSVTINDIGGYPPESPPIWRPDGSEILVYAVRKGDQPILSITVGPDPEVKTLLDTPGVNGTISIDQSGKRIAYFHASMQEPGQIYCMSLDSGASVQLTSVNDWLGEVELADVEVSWVTQPDGPALQTWILKPPGFDPHKRYASILDIHGGPQTQYGNFFLHEAYYWAANGYVVYMTNPRGSQGYGQAYASSIYNQWGTVDYNDVMAVADHMAAQPYIDPERMGVTGGSYGGWMTSLIIGRTHRFRAAAAQRVVSNWVSFRGSSDLSYLAETLFGGGPLFENLEDYIRQSPIFHLQDVRTPTLVIHSENDMRCSPEQGEQLYSALKQLGVDSELLLFPGESHGLSRGGRTDRRIARLNHILRWMDRYLNPEQPSL